MNRDVPEEDGDPGNRRQQEPPIEVLHEHDDPGGDHRNQEEPEHIQVALPGILGGNMFHDERNGRQGNEIYQEECRPADVGSDEATADRAQ